MRTELELIATIEQYLKGELSAEERTAFEREIENDAALKEKVSLQREVMRGIERTMLKSSVQRAMRKYKWGRNFRNWGGIGLGVVAIAVLMVVLSKKGIVLTHGAEAIHVNVSLPAQGFTIDGSQDTVVETKGGIVFSIPAGGFLGADGKAVTGRIQLELREALDAASIMKAGLSTMSGDRLLETGGMFFIDATKDGERLRIDSSKGVYAEVPTDTVRPGMQLFTGKTGPGGRVDWQNPRPLEHSLVPRDILSLDFYPPHYLDSLASWGYDIGNKEFTDSLYYSFASVFHGEAPMLSEESLGDSAVGPKDGIACGIDPAKIKAIRDRNFDNTMIATREFEERLRWMHRQSSGGRLLDFYVHNMDKELWEVDQMAAKTFSGDMKKRLLLFAARKDGKVKSSVSQLNNLRKYYLQKSKEYAAAITKAREIFRNKQAELNQEAATTRGLHSLDTMKRNTELFLQELNLNLKEAYRQLGYDTLPQRVPPQAVYQVRVVTTGWWNVDRYVAESVNNRTTLDYTDSATGKKAVIRYLPVSFQVDSADSYDRIVVYLLPDQFNSYMQVDGSKGVFTGKLNELLQYDVVCIGYRGENMFLFSAEDVASKDYTHISLKPGELGQVKKKAAVEGLQREAAFLLFDVRDEQRQKKNRDRELFMSKIIPVIFPCVLAWPVGMK